MPTYEITLIGLVILHLFAIIGVIVTGVLVGIWLFYLLALLIDKIEEKRNERRRD